MDIKVPKAEVSDEPTIDKDKPRLRKFTINNREYEGVLSTFKAIVEKQKAMGEKEIGVISLPGDESAYELFDVEKEEEKKAKKDEEK
jgi:hypothetical protein